MLIFFSNELLTPNFLKGMLVFLSETQKHTIFIERIFFSNSTQVVFNSYEKVRVDYCASLF